jgi:uncharacterized protein (TIGR01244 family)
VATPDVAIGGAPTPKGLDLLKEAGVRTIVDMRAEAEDPDAPARAVQRGFRYFRVPISPATLSTADLEAVQEVLDEKDRGPVYLHCASGNRTGGVWAALRATAGDPLEQAMAEGERVGLRSAPMKDAVRRVLSSKTPD